MRINTLLLLLLLTFLLFMTNASACLDSPCGPDSLLPPSMCTKTVERSDSGRTLTVTYEDLKTFGSEQHSSTASACVAAIGIPENSAIRSVSRIQVLDTNGNPFPGFADFLPVEEAGAVFEKMITGLPVKWNGYHAFLTSPIPSGEPILLVLEFEVNPRASQSKLLKILSSAVLATDAGDDYGAPIFGHLGFAFGLGHKSFKSCVNETVSMKCDDLRDRARQNCRIAARKNCAEIFGF